MNSNAYSLLQKFLSIKGQIVRAEWQRPMKVRAKVSQSVEKRVIATVRAGVDYDKMKDVIAKRESGELPKENAGLTWGRWAELNGESLFPHVKEHTPKGETEKVFYFRFATFAGGSMKVTYFIDGKEANEAQVRPLCLASEFREDSVRDVFDVRADSILSLGSVGNAGSHSQPKQSAPVRAPKRNDGGASVTSFYLDIMGEPPVDGQY